MAQQQPPQQNGYIPPSPSGQALSLVSALSNPENHSLHQQAIQARDEALSASPESYASLLLQLTHVLLGSNQPSLMISRLAPTELEAWRRTDGLSVQKLEKNPSLWIPFGQMAGFILKNALVRPPVCQGRPLQLEGETARQVKEALLYGLQQASQQPSLKAVLTSTIATTAVSVDAVQPALHVDSWPELLPTLVKCISDSQDLYYKQACLETIHKMMQDGPTELPSDQVDQLVPALLRLLSSPEPQPLPAALLTPALQSLIVCQSDSLLPASLVLHWQPYVQALSSLAAHPDATVRQWVCRSLVTMTELRPESFNQDPSNWPAICQFLLHSTADRSHPSVALEACEFWLAFCSLDEEQDQSVATPFMVETVAQLLPQLIPCLLQNMVYSAEQQAELAAENNVQVAARPIFHKSRAQRTKTSHNNNPQSTDNHEDDEDGYEVDDESDDDDDDDDDDDNEWTLRKCAAASLDALANLYHAAVLAPLLPALQQGLQSSDPWVQEASILALGAIAEGCQEDMSPHMPELHPYLIHNLSNSLPQVVSITAWTLGRYAAWAVDQVQTGSAGHLLAHMTEALVQRLDTEHPRVQVACCSSLGVVVESAGDLMVPYLEPVFRQLVGALGRYQGRSLLVLIDVFGSLAEYCGPAIAEGALPGIYLPPLFALWEQRARQDATDRTLLPLIESLAMIASTAGMNFQPYALESFEKAMSMIEAVSLLLATSGEGAVPSEEDVDPVVCATDMLDGLVEGLGPNFGALLKSSPRFGPHFLNVLLNLAQHEVASVRTSAMALVGDLARLAPAVLEPALAPLLQHVVANIDPIQPSVCTNAVWAMGEICLKCQGNSSVLQPIVPMLLQNVMGLLVGNGNFGGGGGSSIPGLAENAAACVGRLALVDPNFVAPDLGRFLLGWCDGMAKISDPAERHDAYAGFVKVVYANPQAIMGNDEKSSAVAVTDTIGGILFSIVAWHMPPPSEDDDDAPTALLTSDYKFRPFPATEAELGKALAQLLSDMKSSAGEETWQHVTRNLPVNVRRLLREAYQL